MIQSQVKEDRKREKEGVMAMKIVAIEPTPSPNTMKITLDKVLPSGKRNNYTMKNKEEAPALIQAILDIEGVKGVYHVADFMAIERHPKAQWQSLLQEVRSLFGEETESTSSPITEEAFGEVQVFIQMFRSIPMQVKVVSGEEEFRQGLPERFQTAVFQAEKFGGNIVMERKWKEAGVRYGSDLKEIGEEVKEEIAAAYPEDRLERLVKLAEKGEDARKTEKRFKKVTLEMFDQPDWRERYALLEQLDPTEDDLPLLEKALEDEKSSIRRLAVVYLGMIEKPVVLPLLRKALQDPSVTVRRTAGDCYSDLGDPRGIPDMIEALNDKNKLVRWRAAMFLYEVGDESAIPALKKAANDPEFEVAMQAKLALERIERGEEAKGSVWKQMTEHLEESRQGKES